VADQGGRAQRGRQAEELAAEHLTSQGFVIEATNWRCQVGELDVVAHRDDLLVVVEVRSATTPWLSSPAETVNIAKQRRVCRAADAYLQRRPGAAAERIRFDVMAVRFLPEGGAELLHIENAFTPSWAF